MLHLLNKLQGYTQNGPYGNDLMANETDIGQAAGGLGLAIGGAIVQFNKVAVMPLITDLAVHGNADALLVNAGQAIGNAVAMEFDSQCMTGFVDGFSNTVGANTTGMSMQKLFTAVAKLEENSAPRPYACVLHPLNMWGGFGLTNEIATTQTNESDSALSGGSLVGGNIASAGWVANLGGVNMFTSPSVSIADGAGTAQGAVFAKTAIGCGYIDFGGGNFIQIESSRNAPYAATELTANGYFGFVETVDLHGVTILNETV